MPKIKPFEEYTEQYEDWFDNNEYAYQSEIDAIRFLTPDFKKGVEIGVGSGKFASPLGIKLGIEPSDKMAGFSRKRGIEVIKGVGEEIPLDDESFDMVLMVTTLCFLDNAKKAFSEIYRILEKGGVFINGFVDKNSSIGKSYQKKKDKSIFYGEAVFYSIEDVIGLLNETGFKDLKFSQTIFKPVNELNKVEEVKEGYGEGSFVVTSARK